MLDDNKIVHTLWVGKELSKLECLTIKLLQKHQHTVYLWGYEDIKNIPENVIFKDAEEILPRNTIFRYSGQPLVFIPNGGIGSLSHWSDQFQLKLLSMYGGIYLQLDVACLKPLNFKYPYAFISHIGNTAISAFLMKCPKSSLFTQQAYQELKNNITVEKMTQLDWDSSMRCIGNVFSKFLPEFEKYKINSNYFLDLGCRQSGPFFDGHKLHEDVYIIHWSNATVHEKKNNPIKGSIYEFLLNSVGL